MGLISRIQRFSIGDGPGIRTTVFFQGCPLHCPWCHNPETIPHHSFLHYAARCTGCGRCAAICPKGCDPREKVRHGCDLCGACVSACPKKALEIGGREAGVEEILREINADFDFYETSGGGATLSGGEPLWQPDFCAAIAKKCVESGIPVLIDTSACVSFEAFEKVLPYVKLYYIDIKMPTEEGYRDTIGGSLRLVCENMKKLCQIGCDVTARVPVIPGYNADGDSIRRICAAAKDAGVTKLSLLPYHGLGSSKYKAMGMNYPCEDTATPTKEEMAALEKIVTEMGLTLAPA